MDKSAPPKSDFIILDSFDDNTAVAEHLERLLSSLNNKELPVITICIVGTKSSGKSFLLNCILRYLEGKEKKSSVPFGSPGEPLEGFPWKKNTGSQHPCIKIWNKLFTLEINSAKVAILLMDTDGVLDGSMVSSTADHQIFLNFCLSVSKLMIYSAPGSFSSQQLENLKTAAEFHSFTHPGQAFEGKLTILVRDWKMPMQFPYGRKGGKEYLRHIFEVPEGPSASREILDKISRFYGNINCFLMPFPGGYVAGFENEEGNGKSFDGSMKDLPAKYLRLLESFVEETLSADTVQAILDSWRKFSLEDFISAFELTESIYRNSFLQPYIEKYEEHMDKEFAEIYSEDHLTSLHEHYLSDLVENLVQSIGRDPTLTPICTAELRNRLSESLQKFKNRNKGKRENKRREKAISTAKSEYTAAMAEQTASVAWFYPWELVRKHHLSFERATSVLINEGFQDCKDVTRELTEACEESLKSYKKENYKKITLSLGTMVVLAGLAVLVANHTGTMKAFINEIKSVFSKIYKQAHDTLFCIFNETKSRLFTLGER